MTYLPYINALLCFIFLCLTVMHTPLNGENIFYAVSAITFGVNLYKDVKNKPIRITY